METKEDKPMYAKFFLGTLMVMAFGVMLILIFKSNPSAEPEDSRLVINPTMEAVKAELYGIDGSKLHVYSFIDSHGRHCTAVYTQGYAVGGWGDCDYPPSD